jgi:hypothetical protein
VVALSNLGVVDVVKLFSQLVDVLTQPDYFAVESVLFGGLGRELIVKLQELLLHGADLCRLIAWSRGVALGGTACVALGRPGPGVALGGRLPPRGVGERPAQACLVPLVPGPGGLHGVLAGLRANKSEARFDGDALNVDFAAAAGKVTAGD